MLLRTRTRDECAVAQTKSPAATMVAAGLFLVS